MYIFQNQFPVAQPQALAMPHVGYASGQMQIVMQMMQLMMGLMSMMFGSGQSPMPMGHPNFGCNCHRSPGASNSEFLGMPYGQNMGSSHPGSGSAPGGTNSSQGLGSVPTDVGNPQSAGGGYLKPLDGNFRISSGFGPRRAPKPGASTYHKGVDLAAPTGTPVRAVKSGRVSISKHQTANGRSTGYGNWIEIKHDDGTSSRYGHLDVRGVQPGQRIEAGQVIGTVGNTGTSTGAHLHFEIRNRQGQAIDPQKVMRF